MLEKQLAPGPPPGPPPRPGLEWKPQTHRWIRPDGSDYTEEKREGNSVVEDPKLKEKEQNRQLAASARVEDRFGAAIWGDQEILKLLVNDPDREVLNIVASRITDLDSLIKLALSEYQEVSISAIDNNVSHLLDRPSIEKLLQSDLFLLDVYRRRALMSSVSAKHRDLFENDTDFGVLRRLVGFYINADNQEGLLRIVQSSSSEDIKYTIADAASGKILEFLANDSNSEIRAAAMARISYDQLLSFVHDTASEVRFQIARRAKEDDEELLSILSRDPVKEIREIIANKALSDSSALENLMRDSDDLIRQTASRRISTDKLHRYLEDPYSEVRRNIARRIPAKYLHKMSKDSDAVVRENVARRMDPEELISMINDENYMVRNQVARRIPVRHLDDMLKKEKEDPSVLRSLIERANQDTLKRLKTHKVPFIQAKVASRIDPSELESMIPEDESNIGLLYNIIDRIEPSKLHLFMKHSAPFRYKITERANFDLLEKLKDDPDPNVSARAHIRIHRIQEIGKDTVDHFNKSHFLPEKLSPELKAKIKKIASTDRDVGDITKPIIEELYRSTPFSNLHRDSIEAWEGSSSSRWGLAIKDSVGRQFDGSIKFHDYDTTEDITDKREQLWAEENQALFDEYVRVHKNLTQRLLEIAFPGKNEFTLYRGTTLNEAKFLGEGTRVKLTQNPVSSWTLSKDVAYGFARKEKSVVVKVTVPKSEIWSTFASHSFHGNEREILLIGKEGREGEVVTSDE